MPCRPEKPGASSQGCHGYADVVGVGVCVHVRIEAGESETAQEEVRKRPKKKGKKDCSSESQGQNKSLVPENQVDGASVTAKIH